MVDDLRKKLWCERFRPTTLDEVIIPARLKSELKKFVAEGEIPSLLLSGPAGTGKTTVARCLANDLGCDFYMINGSKDSGIDMLRTKVVSYASTVSVMNPDHVKIILIDEADYLGPLVQASLRGVIEEFWNNCRFIFTCNYKNRMIPALHSRCSVVDFSATNEEKMELMASFMKRVIGILITNKVEYNPAVLAQFIKNHYPDFRRTLNELQRYATCGTIDDGILAASGDNLIEEIVDFLKSKNFKKMREWVDVNDSVDQNLLFDKMYDRLINHIMPQSAPELILTLDDYQNKAAVVVNQRINLAACFITLMSLLEWR